MYYLEIPLFFIWIFEINFNAIFTWLSIIIEFTFELFPVTKNLGHVWNNKNAKINLIEIKSMNLGDSNCILKFASSSFEIFCLHSTHFVFSSTARTVEVGSAKSTLICFIKTFIISSLFNEANQSRLRGTNFNCSSCWGEHEVCWVQTEDLKRTRGKLQNTIEIAEIHRFNFY